MGYAQLNYTKLNKIIGPIIVDFALVDLQNSYTRLIQRLLWIMPRLTHLSLVVILWDIGKQHCPRCDAAERGVLFGAILFAQRNFIEK